MKINEITRIKLGQTDNKRALQFIEELNALSSAHPINHNMRVLDNVMLHVSPAIRRNTVHIHDLKSINPGKGNATRVMNILKNLAEKYNVRIDLFAVSLGDNNNHPNTERLIKWYQGLGFHIDIDNYYYDDDDMLDLEDGVDMIYIPG